MAECAVVSEDLLVVVGQAVVYLVEAVEVVVAEVVSALAVVAPVAAAPVVAGKEDKADGNIS